ncbi:hypothetical protein IW140_001039 [Coemansia sp. RSA 1813]|nr:hypothetical protein EV178_005174 [Coemansia sp. RSA 1646]KAJ1769781.1 hypothetical protein LPJ74_003753 [Coemansia sp. RSA 1843]KAJ2086861.1 hypothetical protein IW138_005384 [Coemansia sp. RSA 986]KAJ2215190.1 hypothetical protein EV179_002409 [Coemansia sp. RSA 487]KAJ2572290.1 hypothetical protein IW140_001039 [Coemansia sp. RSA 1813]
MTKPNRLEFELDQPDIVLRGMVDDAPGTVFSGRLVVRLAESIRVKGLSMALEGHEHLEWEYHNDGAISTFHRETTPITHSWTFFTTANGKRIETWEAGCHEFPFSFVFPGNLPESIDIPYAKVAYSLKATLRRTGIMSNIVAKRDLQVKRDLTMDGAFGTGAIDVENCWRNKLEFRIASDADTFKPGDQMRARFTFQPLVKQVHLTKIGVILKEYVRCHTPLGNAEKTVSRVAAFSELVPEDRGGTDTSNLENALINECLQRQPIEAHLPSPSLPSNCPTSQELADSPHAITASRNNAALGSSSAVPEKTPNAPAQTTTASAGIDLTHVVEENLRLKIPKEMRRLQYDHISSYIEVTHKLKFSIHFNDPDHRPHTLWVSVPVSVVPTIAGGADSMGSGLPSYANAALDPRIPTASIEQGPPAYDTVMMETLSSISSQDHSCVSSSAPNSDTSSCASINSTSASIHCQEGTSLQQYPTQHPVATMPLSENAIRSVGSAASTASSSSVHIDDDNDNTRSVRRIGHSRVSVDATRPLVHPTALHNFLRRPVVFPASAEATPLQTPLMSPAATPMESPFAKASEDVFSAALANTHISVSHHSSVAAHNSSGQDR